MGDVVSNYETLFIVNPDIGDEAINSTVAKFTDLISANGSVSEKSEWGKKRLSYPIQNFEEGYYVLINFSSEPKFPIELDRIFNITDTVLRSIIVKK